MGADRGQHQPAVTRIDVVGQRGDSELGSSGGGAEVPFPRWLRGADNGRWLRALDAAAAADPTVSTELDRALVGPRQLLEQLVANAPHPPANPHEFALLLMATHRAYLLDTFGGGHDSPQRRANATAALIALWDRVLAE